MTYSEKLRDPRWQKMRLLVMERDGFQCTHCEAEDKTLNVHHKVYRRGRDPWAYPDEELTTLCEDCHEELESKLCDLRLALQNENCIVTVDEVLGFVNGRFARELPADFIFRVDSDEDFNGFVVGFLTSPLLMGQHPVMRRLRNKMIERRGAIAAEDFLGIVVKDEEPEKVGL